MKSSYIHTSIIIAVIALIYSLLLERDTQLVVNFDILTGLMYPFFRLGYRLGIMQELMHVTYDDSGFKFMRNMLSKEHFDAILAYKPDEKDIFVVTFPKSGTHLLSQLVLQAVEDGKAEFDHIHHAMAVLEIEKVSPRFPGCEPNILDIYNIKAMNNFSKNIIATHNAPPHVPFSDDSKYIVMIRSPLDTLLSGLEMMKKAVSPRLVPNIREMYEMRYTDGLHSWNQYNLAWWEMGKKPNVLILFYEDAIKNLTETVIKVREFLGKSTDADIVERIRYLSSMEYMKPRASKFEPPKCAKLFPIEPPAKKVDMINKGKSRDKSKVPPDIREDMRNRFFETFKGTDFPVWRYKDAF